MQTGCIGAVCALASQAAGGIALTICAALSLAGTPARAQIVSPAQGSIATPAQGSFATPGQGQLQASEPLAYPRRRSGLWEISSTSAHASGLPPTRYCIGEQTDRPDQHLDRSSGTKGSCTMGVFKRAGNAWVAESVCREGKVSIVSKAIASGNFDSEYRIDTVVTYEPPMAGIRREDKDAVRGVYLGPCLEHQRAGDMIIPGMGTLNMIDGSFKPEQAPPAARRRKGT